MDAAVGQALDVSLDPLDVGRERSEHRLDLAASERAVQLLDLLEIGHVGSTKPSRPLCTKSEDPLPSEVRWFRSQASIVPAAVVLGADAVEDSR